MYFCIFGMDFFGNFNSLWDPLNFDSDFLELLSLEDNSLGFAGPKVSSFVSSKKSLADILFSVGISGLFNALDNILLATKLKYKYRF